MEKNKRQRIFYWSLMLALLAFCGLLGALQYRWIGKVSDAARERMRSDLQNNLRQLSRDFNSQISNAVERLMPAGPAENMKAAEADVSGRYREWKAEGRAGFFRAIALAIPHDGRLELRLLDAQTAEFRNADWPMEWANVHRRLESRLTPHPPGPGDFGRGDPAPVFESPLWTLEANGPRREAGWLIFELNMPYVRAVLLPGVIRRHLGTDNVSDYQIGVVDAHDPALVIFPNQESVPNLARSYDASVGLFDVSPRMFRDPSRGPRPGSPPPGEGPPPDSGRWRMYVRSSAGSLEVLVARARWLNILVTTGILLLILVTVGALIQFTRRAEKLAALQMEFVAGVSHELRTPLSVIHTAAYNLRHAIASEPKQVDRYVELIQQESARLKRLVEQVLQFASAGAGNIVRDRGEVSVSQLIQDATLAVHPVVEQQGCVLEQSVDPALPAVLGDSVALKQAIENLLNNAAKYGCGVNRWIGVYAAKARENNREMVEIRVRDRGPGIPDDERDHIFEPFFRGRSAIRNQVHGTGLGLNLVKRVIEAHHGSVRVNSQAFEGTEFIVLLPAILSEEPNAHSVG